VSLLAILQDQMGLAFARRGEFAEANDHFAEALREDDRFYQAAYDRAIVLLRLGRSDDALRCYFLAAGQAPAGLTVAQRRAFLAQLEAVAAATGRPPLARAAARQLAR
jgi:Flp pilus assembly protein TadD